MFHHIEYRYNLLSVNSDSTPSEMMDEDKASFPMPPLISLLFRIALYIPPPTTLPASALS